MSTEWRRRILTENRVSNDAYFAEHEAPYESDDQYEADLRQQWLAAARHYDPDARLNEELVLRLCGDLAERGALNFRIADALLRPLRDGVSAAARRAIDLDLVGISQGSTVLHVQPSPTTEDSSRNDELATVDSSTADPAIRELLQLVRAVEDEGDVRPWDRMIQGLDGVVEALDKFDLAMEMRWHALDGAVRTSTLTRRGKGYVRSLRKLEVVKAPRVITGRVVELRESGIVKVKTGASRTSKSYTVRLETHDLIDMHLELGVNVSFLVEQVEKRDRLGRERSTEFRFLRRSDEQQQLPEHP